MDIESVLAGAKIVPVIVIDDAEKAVPLARALVSGGLPVIEVTFRTAAAASAIEKIAKELPEAVVGAGTLLTPEQVEAARNAGAVFGVAPGFDPVAVEAAKRVGLPFIPGISSASELSQALSAGCRIVKFFPAEAAGGVSYIKNLLGAFRFTGVKFMPTGGIKPSNVGDYLAVEEIICVGGTWIAPKKEIEAENWAEIERLAAEARTLAV